MASDETETPPTEDEILAAVMRKMLEEHIGGVMVYPVGESYCLDFRTEPFVVVTAEQGVVLDRISREARRG